MRLRRLITRNPLPTAAAMRMSLPRRHTHLRHMRDTAPNPPVDPLRHQRVAGPSHDQLQNDVAVHRSHSGRGDIAVNRAHQQRNDVAVRHSHSNHDRIAARANVERATVSSRAPHSGDRSRTLARNHIDRRTYSRDFRGTPDQRASQHQIPLRAVCASRSRGMAIPVGSIPIATGTGTITTATSGTECG